jgi:hypothetical protein
MDHLRRRFLPEPRAVEHRLEEARVVERGRVEAGCRVRHGGATQAERTADGIVSDRLAPFEAVLPCVAAVRHPQRLEDQSSHQGFESLPGPVLDGLLQVDEALARVAKSLARLEVDLERLPVRPPVREPCRVRQDAASRDRAEPRVLHIVSGKVLREGRVEIEPARIRELQDGVREDRLGERSRLEDRVVVDAGARAFVPDSEGPAVNNLSVLDDGEGKARHVSVLHQARHEALERGQLLLFQSVELACERSAVRRGEVRCEEESCADCRPAACLHVHLLRSSRGRVSGQKKARPSGRAPRDPVIGISSSSFRPWLSPLSAS